MNYCNPGKYENYDDIFMNNKNSRLVPEEVHEGIVEMVLVIISQKVEIGVIFLRPFILQFIREFFGGVNADIIIKIKHMRQFKDSGSWVCLILDRATLSYCDIVNNVGGLPDNWEE